MDRDLLEQRLAAAERNVALGLEAVADQRRYVGAIEAWGLDASYARRMLRALEEMQAGFVEDLAAAGEQLDADDQRKAV